MKIALIQMQSGSNKDVNLKKAERMIRQAADKDAKFILLPEVFVFRGKFVGKNSLIKLSESVKSTVFSLMSRIAKKENVHILAGTFFENIKNSKKVYNTSILIGSNGHLKETYRKKNLFKAIVSGKTIDESKHFMAGKKMVVAGVNGFCAGVSICYDVRFSSIYSDQSKLGVNVLCIPSAFTEETGKAHWEVLLRARAIETLSYVLAPNQVGCDEMNNVAYGNSMVVDPWGKVIARASGKEEEILYAELDLKEIAAARDRLPRYIKQIKSKY